MKLLEMILVLALAGSFSAALGCPQEKGEGAAAPAPAAGIHGVWELKEHRGEATLNFTLELRQEGGALAGALTGPEGRSLRIGNASFSGNVLKFSVVTEGGTYQAVGTLECDHIAGAYTDPAGGSNKWEAKRRSTAAATPPGNPLTSAADVEVGRKYFLGHCALCHGSGGEGGRGTNLTTGQYRHGGEDHDLFQTIQKGVPGTEMPGSQLSENEIWRIVAYVRRLARAGAEEKAPRRPLQLRESTACGNSRSTGAKPHSISRWSCGRKAARWRARLPARRVALGESSTPASAGMC